VQPGQNYGGVTVEITPSIAGMSRRRHICRDRRQLLADLDAVPLMAGAASHRVRAPGYQTMVFDADIVAGQVIPYRGVDVDCGTV
jgi:hypothetical protein